MSVSEFQLRPYQLQAVNELRKEFELGKTAVVLVAPTGSGKTAVGCHFVKQAVDQGKRCLWLAHRTELIRQASQRLAQDYHVRHGIIKAGVPESDPSLPVQIASVQTLVRRKPLRQVGLLVIDEAHHATADSYLRIIKNYPGAKVLGLTATPWRLTGKALGSLFDGLTAVSNYPFLIRSGYLVRPRVFIPKELPDFSGVRRIAGEYDENAAAAIMERPHIVGDLLQHWKQHAVNKGQQRSTIVFACNVEHSKHIVQMFVSAGISAEHLDAQVPEAEREAVLNRLAQGKTKVVSNVLILSEGFDCPSVSCVVVARPTASRTLFIQMVGRALRPCPDIAKQDCVILDHAGNSFRHGLTSEITSYELEDGDCLAPEKAPTRPCKACHACRAIVSANASECPECGCVFAFKGQLPVTIKGQLIEVPTPSIKEATEEKATQTPNTSKPHKDLPKRELSPFELAITELTGNPKNTYERILLNPQHRDATALLRSIKAELESLKGSEKLAYVKAGLFFPRPDLWLELMRQTGCLSSLGLHCLETLAACKPLAGYKGPSPFQKTCRAILNSKPNVTLRLAALFHAIGIPDQLPTAERHGMRVVRWYAAHSAALAGKVFELWGVVGEVREAALELISHHEYLFDQILNSTKAVAVSDLFERWRKKLGPLCRLHVDLAECLWDGSILRWIQSNRSTILQGFDRAEGKLFAERPEDACPVGGQYLIERYKRKGGLWIGIMLKEIGQWCLGHPDKAHDLVAVGEAADKIFFSRQNNPQFNSKLPFLYPDQNENLTITDPLGIRPLLIEAARLKTGEVREWAVGYRRKAIVAIISAVTPQAKGQPTASLAALFVERVVSLLPDITLGELLKGLTPSKQTNPAVATAQTGTTSQEDRTTTVAGTVRQNRATLVGLRRMFEQTRSKEAMTEYVCGLRNAGHFEQAMLLAQELSILFGPDPHLEKLYTGIRQFVETDQNNQTKL